MKLVAQIVVGFVALLHIAFLVLEMFLWDSPTGERVFGLPREQLHDSATLAANQGLYNGFLAAGLVWGLVTSRRDVKVFFLACIIVAGVFGGATAKATILFTQALPALIAMALVFLSSRAQKA